MTALDHAIRTAGSANRLATAIGVSGMAISQWKKITVLFRRHEF